MSHGDSWKPGDRFVTCEGRRGTIVKVERCWINVRFDSDDEFTYTYHASDRWILPVDGEVAS